MGKRSRYFMIVTPRGYPATMDARVPIYWYKKVAEEKKEEYFPDKGYKVVTVLVQKVI